MSDGEMKIPGLAPARAKDEKEVLPRNPTIVPLSDPLSIRTGGCPECGHDSYDGRNVQGTITWTCHKCRNKWQGGLGRPIGPTEVIPPSSYTPPVDFLRRGDGTFVESRKPVSKIQSFRKGAPIPPPGEEDV